MAQRRPTTAVSDPGQAVLGIGVLAGFVGYALRRAQLSVFEAFASALAEFDLRPGDFGVLIVIDSNQALRSIDVCTLLGIQKTNFVILIGRLEERGLVARVADRKDRRAQMLQLTVAGKRLLQRALKAHAKLERRFEALLGAEQMQLFVNQCNQLAQLH